MNEMMGTRFLLPASPLQASTSEETLSHIGGVATVTARPVSVFRVRFSAKNGGSNSWSNRGALGTYHQGPMNRREDHSIAPLATRRIKRLARS